MKMTLGADPKKVKWLGGLFAVLLGVWFFNSSSTPDSGPPSSSTSKSPIAPPAVTGLPGPPTGRREVPGGPRRAGSRATRASVQDFKPKLFDKDNPVDPTKVDPTLNTVLLARLQNVGLAGGARSLFDVGPVVEVPKGPLIRPVDKPKGEWAFQGPKKPEPPKPPAPPTPPAPIPLKFYGFVFSYRDGVKKAFFMDGEEILVAKEGDIMKNKYKLVRLGVNSAVVEDVPNKNQQALPLVEEQQASAAAND